MQRLSGYDPPALPLGWIMSLVWVVLGIALTVHWWCWLAAHKCTRIRRVRMEAVVTNAVMLASACAAIIVGLGTMGFQSFELPLCPCEPGFYGRTCDACDCSGHGLCDDGVDGTGECFCDALYDGERCDACVQRAGGYPDCACDAFWTGADCATCAVGFNCSTDPITCAEGWVQTGPGPVCGACDDNYGGDPTKGCRRCLGDAGVCNGRGLCWDNARYASRVWECDDCAPGVPDGGLHNQCTRTFFACDDDSDCATSNCRGVCQSLYAPPVGPTQQWVDSFGDKPCRTDAECNFERTAFDDAGLPDGWWQEGQCTERVCCEEHRYGNATCFNCTDADGSPSIGRMPPACDACPGFDAAVDQDGQTICNGHGTCVPSIDPEGAYEGMRCACAGVWSESDCRCLSDGAGNCSACAVGFHLPVDPIQSMLAGHGVSAHGPCDPCPGAENGTGLGACNFMRGYGQCIYADDITPGARLEERLARVGTCACTTALDAPPQIAATGPACADAPPGFFDDGAIRPCPRVLVTGACVDGARWNYTRLDGSEHEICVEVCGGTFGLVATCTDAGHCECNASDFLPDPGLEAHYALGFNGLCRKTPVQILV